MLRGERAIDAAFGGHATAAVPEDSETESIVGDIRRNWNDNESAGSLEGSDGIVDAATSDVENPCEQFRGYGDRVMIADALYGEGVSKGSPFPSVRIMSQFSHPN